MAERVNVSPNLVVMCFLHFGPDIARPIGVNGRMVQWKQRKSKIRKAKHDHREHAGLDPTGEATAMLPAGNLGPITVIGTEAIRATFDDKTLGKRINSRLAPGVTDVVLNPDAHVGYGAPIGCVMVSPSHIYPGPVGVDIKCSMSLLQLDLPADAIQGRPTRRALIKAICERTPRVREWDSEACRNPAQVDPMLGQAGRGRGRLACGLQCAGHSGRNGPHAAKTRLHTGHDETHDALAERIDRLLATAALPKFAEKVTQLGSYGGGNHFGECEVVQIADNPRHGEVAKVFGLMRQSRRIPFPLRLSGHGLQPGLGPVSRAPAEVRDLGHPVARR